MGDIKKSGVDLTSDKNVLFFFFLSFSFFYFKFEFFSRLNWVFVLLFQRVHDNLKYQILLGILENILRQID